MNCPFCGNIDIANEPGETFCPKCSTRFEIDDRSECIFVDPDHPRLPIKGTICSGCGLVQGGPRKACTYCGERLYLTIQ